MRILFVMDAIASINIKKDSTFAMLLAAQERGWKVYYTTVDHLFFADGHAQADIAQVRVQRKADDFYQLGEFSQRPLQEMDVIMMRKDPPFNMEFIYATYLLELAEKQGAMVVNRPQSLRDANEKLFTAVFPQCCPPTLVTRSARRIREFIDTHQDCIIKPLDGMGGASIFRLQQGDANTSVVLELMTDFEKRFTMIQRYLPEIAQGDKRILMINGQPVDNALARFPAPGESRGNLAAGGRGEAIALSERDRWLAAQIGPELSRRGIWFAGLDVIGDYVTEINVTSPTCIQEIDNQTGSDIAGQLMDTLARHRL